MAEADRGDKLHTEVTVGIACRRRRMPETHRRRTWTTDEDVDPQAAIKIGEGASSRHRQVRERDEVKVKVPRVFGAITDGDGRSRWTVPIDPATTGDRSFRNAYWMPRGNGGRGSREVLMRDVAVERTRGVEHVRAHPPRGFLAVAFGDRAHDRVVFRTRTGEALVLAELHAAEGVEPRPHCDRLVGQEVVVRRTVDRLVELAVERVIGVDIARHDRRLARLMYPQQTAAFERRDPVGGEPDAHRLELRHRHDP